MSREWTHALYDAIKEGLVDKDVVINACLNYMPEDEIQDMCEQEGLLPPYMEEELNGE